MHNTRRSSYSVGLVLVALVSALLALLWPSVAQAAPDSSPIVLTFDPGGSGLEVEPIRRAVEVELSTQVTTGAEAAHDARVLRVVVDDSNGRVVATYQDRSRSISRTLTLPRDRSEATQVIALLAGNLVRDQASEIKAPASSAPAPKTLKAPPPQPLPTTSVGRSATAQRQWWVGVSAGWGLAFTGSSNTACLLDSGYYCTTPDGDDYPSRSDPAQNERLRSGVPGMVAQGLAPANPRFMLSLQRAVGSQWMVGVRGGIVTRTYPGAAASDDGKVLKPFHLEARAWYFFSPHFADTGWATFVGAGAGIAHYSALVGPVSVREGPGSSALSTMEPRVWSVGGPAFASIGFGIRYAMSPGFAVLLTPLQGTIAFGASTMVLLTPEIEMQVGF